MPADHASRLAICADQTDDIRILDVEGFLDSTTYLPLRDVIIKAALDGHRAVMIDITKLVVPSPSALAVFTSARWLTGQWPDVPIIVVCAHVEGRNALARNGITRYVPVFPTTADAIAAMSSGTPPPYRRRAHIELPRAAASLSKSRAYVAEWLTAWSKPELVPVAKLLVTVLVENVLAHTQSAPGLRVECAEDLVTIAVEDKSAASAVRQEKLTRGVDDVAGLAIVTALCRAWGNSPTPTGKTVWATIGPENRL